MRRQSAQGSTSHRLPAGWEGLLAPALVALCVLLPWAEAWAQPTQRLAVVVGHNVGAPERPVLRFAERDASKVARVLVELGDVQPQDVWLLQGLGVAQLEQALSGVRERVARWRQSLGRTVLYFYFSGHSDGEALELAGERLSYATLRALLAGTGAEVRLSFVDACKSGAGILGKGGRPAPAYEVRLHDELRTSGEALLTSSAADELSLESSEVGGGIFTTHLVSGLRGAADVSADGRVTLAELYRYAYERTVSATAATSAGPQHPAYEMCLSGRGEVVLTQVTRASSSLSLPEGAERALVHDVVSEQLMAELVGGRAASVPLPPGSYALTLVRGGKRYGGRFALGARERRSVRWEELAPVAALVTAARGGPVPFTPVPALPESSPVWLTLSGGGRHASGGPTFGPLLRLGLERSSHSDWVAGVSATWGRFHLPLGFNSYEVGDTRLHVRGGYRWVWQQGVMGLWAGLEAGVGLKVLQNALNDGRTLVNPSSLIGPRAGFHLTLGRAVRVGAFAEGLLGLPFDDSQLGIGVETGLAF